MPKKTYSFNLNDDSKTKLQELAEAEDLNQSLYLRRLINETYQKFTSKRQRAISGGISCQV